MVDKWLWFVEAHQQGEPRLPGVDARDVKPRLSAGRLALS